MFCKKCVSGLSKKIRFCSDISRLYLALDDIMTSEDEIANEIVMAHYYETCSELGIKIENQKLAQGRIDKL